MKRYRAIPEFYDAENARHAMLQHDVPFFLGQLPKARQSVLELATGTGRAAIPIAQSGHRVVGIDNDDRMLAIAKRKRDAVGLKDRDLSLAQGDILTLDLGKRFDWVCVFFNTFLAFTTTDEQDRALASVARHLKPNGRLWLDVFYPDLVRLARRATLNLDPFAFHVPRYDRTVMLTTDVRAVPGRAQVRRVTFRYTWFDRHGQEHRRRNEFDLTWLFPRELELLLARHGLKVERLFGNYDGSPCRPHSPRIIARCCRA